MFAMTRYEIFQAVNPEMFRKFLLSAILILLFTQSMPFLTDVFGVDEPSNKEIMHPAIIKLKQYDFGNKETGQDSSKIIEPIKFKILIDLVDIEEIDLKNEAYELVFWIYVSSDEINFLEDNKPQLDFLNGRINLLMEEVVSENFYKAKIFGTFFSDHVQFDTYPFMEFPIYVKVQPLHNIDHVTLLVDDEKFEDVVSIPGWILKDISVSVTNEEGPKSQIYSTFVAKYTLEKPVLSAFLSGIFPMIVMLIMAGILPFILRVESEFRVEIIVVILIAAIFFHVSDLGNSLPPLAHLTLEDKMMTVLYSMLMVWFAQQFVEQRTNPENDEKKTKSINRKMLYVQLLVVLVLSTIFIFI